MPEYLAPGVYVEETSFRSKSIEGVGTSTSAFVGPTAFGPVGGPAELLTSFADFERIYGGIDNLVFGNSERLNYLAHAVRAYYNNGGSRLYVVRVFNGNPADAAAESDPVASGAGNNAPALRFLARSPGAVMNGAHVRVGLSASPVGGPGFLARQPDGTTLRVITGAGNAQVFSVWIKTAGKYQKLKADQSLEAVSAGDQNDADSAELLSINVTVVSRDDRVLADWEGLSPHSASPRYIGSMLAMAPTSRSAALTQPIALVAEENFAMPNAIKLLEALVGAQPKPKDKQPGIEPVKRFSLKGGNDGAEPIAASYETANQVPAGFDLLAALEDVSIVAAPGYSSYAETAAAAIQNKLINHVEKPRMYRIGVLDAPLAKTPSEMREERGKIDSTRAALYYPWVTIANPLAGPGSTAPSEIQLPPSGFVAGIYARNDVQRGVHKAPANEIVRDALRFEREVNFAEQELLNPIGVNCLRYLSGRGYRIWGARTVSSDPEWKYVNVRRYFNYLESSIDRGTQWAVFEPNNELLWANIRGTIGDFLYSEWRTGALLGAKPEQAYFVRCDRSTMTQNDLDNGRMICLIGVAPVRPAEFVIFRVGQWTADASK